MNLGELGAISAGGCARYLIEDWIDSHLFTFPRDFLLSQGFSDFCYSGLFSVIQSEIWYILVDINTRKMFAVHIDISTNTVLTSNDPLTILQANTMRSELW